MDISGVLAQAKRILEETNKCPIQGYGNLKGILVEAKEFARVYGGKNNSYYAQLCEIKSDGKDSTTQRDLRLVIESFIRYIENGLLNGISIKRQAEIDVVSDILSQAKQLLDDKKVHPAAPAMIIGATLEEFLRNWIEEGKLSIGNKKPSIDAYASTLRETDQISRQDKKDIDSWGGLRNHAAHGEWEEVNTREKIEIMLSGVNLFMSTYGNH